MADVCMESGIGKVFPEYCGKKRMSAAYYAGDHGGNLQDDNRARSTANLHQ